MADLRTLLAAVLGVALGATCLLAPETVVRVHLAGRRPRDAGGEYGADAGVPARWRRLVRVVGTGVLAAGLYFAASALAVL